MKQYNDRNTTPLTFHNIYRYTLIPLNILSLMYELYYILLKNGIQGNVFYIIYDIIALILIMITFVGFFRFKKYSYYTLISALFLSSVCISYQLILCIVNNISEIKSILTDFIIINLKTIFISIYYYHRRKIFG